MAIFFDAPVEPDALTAFVREVPLPSGLRLINMFGRRDIPTDTVDFLEIVRTNRTAKYRSWDGRIHVSSRDIGSEKRVKLIPLSSSLNMGEYERLQLEFARTRGTNQELLADSIYNDATNLTSEVINRLELGWGDVVTDGKLTIDEGGLEGFEADFGVPATQLVTAGTAWTNPAAPILDDLIAWLDVYVGNNGVPPAQMLNSRRIQRLMQVNTQLIGAAVGSTSGKTRLNLNELNDLFQAEGIPALSEPYDTVLDVDGTSTRVVPEDRLVFLPADPATAGRTTWGVSATALELVNSNQVDLSFEEAPGVVGVVIKEGPPFRQYTFVDAVAMPILEDAKKLMTAEVF